MTDLDKSITSLKGIGKKTADLYAGLGISSLGDLIRYYPRTYILYPEPVDSPEDIPCDGKMAAICGCLHKAPVVRSGRTMQITAATLYTEGSSFQLIWFRAPYMRSQIPVGQQRVFYGRVHREGKRISLQQASVFLPEAYEAIRRSPQPLYALTKGITNASITRTMRQALAHTEDLPDMLPQWILKKRGLLPLSIAVRQMHFPDSFNALVDARRRLVYDEFLIYSLKSRLQKEQQLSHPNLFPISDYSEYERIRSALPYQLTRGQEECLGDILSDLSGDVITQRLIQGDVGSGKTILAFLAMLLMVSNGYQAALMAPTEVLARQHAAGFEEMLSRNGLPYKVVLLTGSMTRAEKRNAYDLIATEHSLFIIGTHALFQEKVTYQRLSLVITDEQHRFGVRQRDELAAKGTYPHTIVMSATPIPRTLSMILYGGMPVSVIRDMPAWRLVIKTAVIKETLRDTAYRFILRQIQEGHQAYVICPMIEASDQMDAENVEDYAAKLKRLFTGRAEVGALNGRMKAADKNRMMEDFARGKIQILVSTTVVEVGVNVPNATVMMIENADRFGLAQLHQLRGRVGRGDAQSYCILVDTSEGEDISRRLSVLKESTDGFYIAEQDLAMRGPGDFYGIRQSGEMNFTLGDIWQDADILQDAAQDAQRILDEDPPLENPHNQRLAALLEQMDKEMYTNL